MSLTVYVNGKLVAVRVVEFEPPQPIDPMDFLKQRKPSGNHNYLALQGKPKPINYRMRRQRFK